MRLPKLSTLNLPTLPSRLPTELPKLEYTEDLKRKLMIGVPAAFVLLVALMSVSSGFHAKFNWVPVGAGNIVVDSVLKLILGVILLAIAMVVILPLAMGTHIVGHGVAGHFFGMRLLAMRVGPFLVVPEAIDERIERLPVKSKWDVLTGWVHFDDSSLPTWKRPRGWQVMLGGGSAMNLGVSFVLALMSVFFSGIIYVLMRQAVWLNLAVAVVNMIPFVWPRFEWESDGKKLMAMFMGDGAEDEELMERLRDEVIVGPIRPASWPRERETAWETKLRQTAVTDQVRADQVETMVYLFLQAVDRSDSEVAWRWVQAMQNAVSAAPANHDLSLETARVMCALYAARWERNAEGAQRLIEQVSPDSGIMANPWYTVARAAISLAEASDATFSADIKLEEARRRAIRARDQLAEPARLHGIDQLMRGLAQAIAGDVDVELQKQAYFAGNPAQGDVAAA
jgi:hypothetical protein